jgi:hypothetical protein
VDAVDADDLISTGAFSRAGSRDVATLAWSGIFDFCEAFTPLPGDVFSFKGVEAVGEASAGDFLREELLAILPR